MIMKKAVFLLIAAALSFNAFAMEIESSVLSHGGYIPDRYTCDAQDVSPAITWSGVPANCKSLVLICDDSDASFKIWVHWLIYNIPVSLTGFKEGVTIAELKEQGAIAGRNDFGKLGYGGPCPPQGKPHRYNFKLYALDTTLSFEQEVTKKELVIAMQGHIIAEARLLGMYQR